LEPLEQIIERFSPISLEEMDATRLMNRTDTKYVLTREELLRLLPNEFYHVHQNGKKNRVKVRLRKYVDSELTFLEVKHKNNKGRTIKFRKRITDLRDELSAEDLKYIEEMSGLTGTLESKLTNSFERITLVHKKKAERLTFDLNLSFDQSEGNEVLSYCRTKARGLQSSNPLCENTQEEAHSSRTY
jgi:hypothetical protein